MLSIWNFKEKRQKNRDQIGPKEKLTVCFRRVNIWYKAK